MNWLKSRLERLREVWLYSDSQPTEILLASLNIFLTPIATYLELGSLLVLQFGLIISGLFQLLCISTNDIDCRVRGSMITFGFYMTTLVFYLMCLGLPTPSHFGWVVLVFASFSSLRRISKEKFSRL